MGAFRYYDGMPANLTHRYLKAEREYRAASTLDDELACLQTMLRELPKHKGTDKLQAELKHKISQARKDLASQKTVKRGPGIRIPRQGAGRIVMLGGPNSGRSQFMATTTRAQPSVADYPFTTREPLPAMMPWEDIAFQLVDTQPITRDYLDPHLQGLIRGADIVLLFLDLGSDEGHSLCRDVVDKLNATKTRLGRSTKLDPQDIGRSYTQTFLVVNKADAEEADLRWELICEEASYDLVTFHISALTGEGIRELQQAIFGAIEVVRIYTKLPTAKDPDFEKPFTLRKGGSVRDVATLVHKDFTDQVRSARIWRHGIHDGTIVTADFELYDRDIVELHVV